MRIRHVSTMFVALYGELALHPWHDPVAAESDAYSLFVARSSAMGWLTDTAGRGVGGVWGMNDAGQEPNDGMQSLRVWFQVGLPVPPHADQLLPIQAFLACAGDVVERMGTMRLQGVQLLLPLDYLPTAPSSDAVGDLLGSMGWFADPNSQLRTRVRATIGSGHNPAIHAAAPGMLQWMQRIRQYVFTCNSYSLEDEAAVLQPVVPNVLWPEPGLHQAAFYGDLVEWSLDGLGWLAAFLASASSHQGINTSVMLTVTRSEDASV